MSFPPDNPDWKVIASPNRNERRGQASHVLVHFTAAGSAKGSAKWFADPKSKASAHLVIERDGSIFQCVPLAERAWHAGVVSQMLGKPFKGDLNSVSLGIELANWGRLTKKGDQYLTYLGKLYTGEVGEARDGSYWEPYPSAQLLSAIRAVRFLVKKYPAITKGRIEGHEDVAPGRKTDPGPLFPMTWFRDAVFDLNLDLNRLDAKVRSSVVPNQEVPKVTEDRSATEHYDEDAELCLVDKK